MSAARAGSTHRDRRPRLRAMDNAALKRTIHMLADVGIAIELTCLACGHPATVDTARLERRHATKRLAEVSFKCGRCNARTIELRSIQRETTTWHDGSGRPTRLGGLYRRGEELRMTCAKCSPGVEIRFTVQAVEEQLNMVNPPLRHVVSRPACPTCRERALVGVAAADAPGLRMRRTALPTDR